MVLSKVSLGRTGIAATLNPNSFIAWIKKLKHDQNTIFDYNGPKKYQLVFMQQIRSYTRRCPLRRISSKKVKELMINTQVTKLLSKELSINMSNIGLILVGKSWGKDFSWLLFSMYTEWWFFSCAVLFCFVF